MSAKWQHRNFLYPSPSTHPPKKHQFENELLYMKIPPQKPRIPGEGLQHLKEVQK